MKFKLILFYLATVIYLLNVGCTQTPQAKEDKIAKEVFEALKSKNWKEYSKVVTNRYKLLSRIQNPNKFVAQSSYSSTMMAPEETTFLRADFDQVLENHVADKENWIDFKSENFKGIKFVDYLREDPLTEFGDLSLLPAAYSFITDKNGKPRNPLIVMVQVKDFMHILGLVSVDLGAISDIAEAEAEEDSGEEGEEDTNEE